MMLRALDRPRLWLLVGYWLIADCVSTIIFFTAIYASEELSLTNERIGVLLLLTQVLAFPNTALMGRISRVYGTVPILCICVAVWLGIIGAFVIRVGWVWLIVVAIATSFVVGTTQALMRAQYSQHVLRERAAELFGWYAIATESSSIAAPLLFGIVSSLFGQRLAMASLMVPLCAGMVLVMRNDNRVKAVEAAERVAGTS